MQGMSLLEQIEALWEESIEKQVSGWSSQLKDNTDSIKEALSKFNEWSPLYVYTSVDQVKKSSLMFSLRYEGRQVALLHTDSDVRITLCKCALDEYKFESKDKTFLWDSDAGAEFRKYFKNLKSADHEITPERIVESEFLTQMLEKSRKKFGGEFNGIQPVQLAKCRFQMPVPISAHSGKPKLSKEGKSTGGGIDILARRREGNKTRLSVWELKRPEAENHHAIEQAYSYAVQIIKMLRARDGSGNVWYRDIFGFSGDVPDKLEIESVVAVSIDNKDEYLKKYQKFKSENSQVIGMDVIKLYVAFYEEKPLRLKMLEV